MIELRDLEKIKSEVPPSGLADIIPIVPNVSLDDIKGLEQVKVSYNNNKKKLNLQYDLRNLMVEFSSYGAAFSNISGGMLSPPTGVLLYVFHPCLIEYSFISRIGPPGCAKTSLVKAIATDSKANFISFNVSDLILSEVCMLSAADANDTRSESRRRKSNIFSKLRGSTARVLCFSTKSKLFLETKILRASTDERLVECFLNKAIQTFVS